MLAGMKRSLFEDDPPFGETFKRCRFSPRKAAVAEKFSIDMENLKKRHPSVTPSVISTILETCHNDPNDASASLCLVEGGSSTDSRSMISPAGSVTSGSRDDSQRSSEPVSFDEDSLASVDLSSSSELPTVAITLAQTLRSAPTEEAATKLAEKFLRNAVSSVSSAEARAQRNMDATKVLLKSLHQINSKAQKTKDAAISEIHRLREVAAQAEQRAKSAEHAAEVLRWHLDQFSKSFSRPFGGGPAGVF